MSIVLQFATQATLGSWAIRVFQRGWATHVDAVLEDGNLLGARYVGGVAIRPPGYAPFTRTQRITIPVRPEVEAAFYGFLYDQVGKPYDTTAIMAFALDRNWREDDSWECSELDTAALEASGAVPELSMSANRVTPNMLMFLASAMAR